MTSRPEDFNPETGAKLKHLQCEGCEDFCTFVCTKCPDERVEISMLCSNICDGCAKAIVIVSLAENQVLDAEDEQDRLRNN